MCSEFGGWEWLRLEHVFFISTQASVCYVIVLTCQSVFHSVSFVLDSSCLRRCPLLNFSFLLYIFVLHFILSMGSCWVRMNGTKRDWMNGKEEK